MEFSSIERKYEKAFLEFSGAAEKKVREEVLAAFKQKHVVNLLDHLKLSDYEMHRKMYGFMSNYCADLGNIELEMAMAIAFDKPLTDENFLDRKLSERDRKALKPIIEKIRTVAAKLRSELSTSYVNQYSLDSYRYRDDIEDIGLGRLLEKHWNADDRYIVFSGGIINGALHLSLRFAEELGFKKAKGKVQSYYYLDGAKPSPKIKEDLDSWMQFQDGIKTFLGNVFTLEPMLEDDFAQVRRIFELSYLSEKHAEDKEIVAREAWVNFAEKQKERLVPEIDLEETVFSSKFPDRIGKLKGASLELAFLMREGKLLPIGLRLSDQQRAGVLRLSNRLTHMLDYLALEVYKEPWSSHVLREKLVECGRRFGLLIDPVFSEQIYARVRDHLKNYYTMGLFSGPHFVKNVKSDTPEAKDIELLKRVKAAFKQRLAESELTVAGAQELALKTCGDEGRGLSAEALLELVQKRISLFKMYGVKTTYLRMEVETDYGGGSYGIDSSPFSKEGYEDCHRLESLITKLNEHLSGEDFFGLGEDKEYKRGMLLEEVERSILAWTKENNIDSGACERLLEKVIILRAWQVGGNYWR